MKMIFEDIQAQQMRDYRSFSVESSISSFSFSSPSLSFISTPICASEFLANISQQGSTKILDELSQEEIIQYIMLSSNNDANKELVGYIQSVLPQFNSGWKNFNKDDDDYLVYCFNFYKEANNTVKNLVRSFITYMKKKCDSLIVECMDSENNDFLSIQKHFKKFVGKQSINNNFLQKIIQDSRYGIQFEYYLKVYSFHWLAKSKISNKMAHLVAIFFILRCFKNQELLEEITTYKKE